MKKPSHLWAAALAALAMTLAAAPAFSQEFRVGVINVDRVLRESNAAKASQAKIEQEFSRREKDIADLAGSLRSASEKYEKEAPTLSESQRATRQRQMAEMERDIQRKRREVQEDFNARRNEEVQGVLDRAFRVVKQMAETEKYDLILTHEVVYISPKHDITEKVIRALNASK